MKKNERLLFLRRRSIFKMLLLMKFTIAFILLTSLQLSAKTYSQDRITINLQSTELKSALRQIEKKSIFRFLYNDEVVSSNQKVSINAVNSRVTEVLDNILTSTTLTYRILNNNLVVITKKDFVPQDIKVSGKITGPLGEAIAGVSVKIKGSNAGTSTDLSGNYSISAPEGSTLVFSSVGYETVEASVNGRSEINLSLKTSTKSIDEVVVIGYGTASKRDLTGSIVKVAGKEVADKPNTNPVASLQSKVAGLSIVNNGTPGSAPDIRIRGTISIGSVGPLYVVDGVFNDNIDYINPNDIESIEILKDPSSLAIFGVRGAAGVIAVTTKRAKSGQVIVNFNTSYGVKKLVDKIQLANADQFKTLYEEEKVNIGAVSPFDYSKWTSNTDWIDAVTRTAHFNANNLSVAASTDRNKFNMGVGFTSDEGIIRHEKLEKILFSMSDEFKISKALRVGFNYNGVRQNNPYNETWVLDAARKVIPMVSSGTKSVYAKNPYGLDSMNQNLYYDLPSIQNSGVINPLVQIENEYNAFKNVEFRSVASVFAELNLAKNLTFKTTLYADMSNVNYRGYTPLYNAYDASVDQAFLYSRQTSVYENDYTYKKFQQDYTLNYKKSFGNHNISAVGGWTTYYFGNFNRYASVKQSATGAAIPFDQRFWYIDNGFGDKLSKVSSSDQRERTTASALFRVLYNYKQKYFLNASFRRDGSSQISPDNRWQNFWALGGAWELSKEDFMADQKIFDFVKVKASMGVLGNQNTYGYDYPFYPGLVGGNAAVFGSNVYNAYSQAYLPNPNLKWETVDAKEAGVELAAFNNRLRFEATYFSKTTKDLMTFIPGSNGVSNGLDNIGSIKNSGVELTASWSENLTKDLKLTVGGNLTTYKNEVLSLASKEFSIQSGLNRTTVGLPIGYFYGYIVEGVYQSYADKLKSPVNTEFSYGPGDLKYKDVNGDGKINTADRTIIGNPTPDFTYGGNISLSYKGLDLGVDVGGVYGNEVYRNWGGTESPFQRVNYAAFKVNRWHGEGTSNWDPILGQDHRINYEASTYGIEDGSYFRIRNIQVGYNLSRDVLTKVKIKSLRIFANFQNLKTWKNNSGYTAEFGGSATSFGVDNAGGAIPVVSSLGLNVTF
jgi:TonB-linked SusC/RagA family outer membrane protein